MAELDYAEYLINRLNFIMAKRVTNAKRDFFQVPSEAYIPDEQDASRQLLPAI